MASDGQGPTMSQRESVLAIALSCSVPLYAIELAKLPLAEVLRIAAECGQVVAEKGDVVQFQGGKKGESAAAFNALAKGIACLSFAPGGVTTFGMHFENTHPESKR